MPIPGLTAQMSRPFDRLCKREPQTLLEQLQGVSAKAALVTSESAEFMVDRSRSISVIAERADDSDPAITSTDGCPVSAKLHKYIAMSGWGSGSFRRFGLRGTEVVPEVLDHRLDRQADHVGQVAHHQ